MTRVVVFCEEASCAELVRSLASKFEISDSVLVLEHQGKTDLRRSFPRKIRAWADENVRFLILHDQDLADCIQLKRELLALVPLEKRNRTQVRIVCRELEAWYLGDLPALIAADLVSSRSIDAIRGRPALRDPDRIDDPKRQFYQLHNETGAILLARRIAPHLQPDRSRSHSFRLFIRTLLDLQGP
jgi:hypothetical protein